MLMMRPPARMMRAARCIATKVLLVLIVINSSYSTSEMSAISPVRAMAALLTRMSNPLSSAAAASKRLCTSAILARSTWTGMARPSCSSATSFAAVSSWR